MKKKSICVVIVMIGVFFLYVYATNTTIITKDISPRAKLYLAQKMTSQDIRWQEVSLESTPAPSNSEVSISSCFSFKVPMPIEKKEGNACTVRIFTHSPKANIVVVSKELLDTNVVNSPAVQMRINKPKEYTMSEKIFKGKTYLFFEKEGWAYEKTAFIQYEGNIVSITLSAPSNRDMNEIFDSIVSSFSYL